MNPIQTGDAYAIAAMAFFSTGHWVFDILCVIGALANT